jgi:zinc protease
MRTLKTVSIAAMALALTVQATPKDKPPKPGKPAASYKTLQYPSLNDIKPPQPTRMVLGNGMVVFLVEDHELPTISVAALVRAGDRWEPAAKAGLASIAGSVMRTGGTPTRNGDQLDEALDRLGAAVETSVGEDAGTAIVSVLKEDIDEGLAILADILERPAFPQDKIDLAKIQLKEGVARRNDDPADIAEREFTRLIYGKESPYGHMPEYATLDSITRDDLVAFHKRFFQPENVVLGVWGDFDAEAMKTKLRDTLGAWARGGADKPPVPAVDPQASQRAGVYSIEKDDVNQSTVYMGLLGGKRDDPDFYALNVANTILGYGFSSRLVNKVRTEMGLAYSVGSSWSAGWDRPGLFYAEGGVKSESTAKFINAVREQIRSMTDGVTPAELTLAKDTILKGFAFEFDSTAKVVQRMMRYEYFGYPADYLQQYRANIDKVTAADVQRVAGQYLKPENLAILVLGKSKDFDQPLSALGKVAPIDITIPPPARAAREEATPESAAKGRAALAAAREAMGAAAVMGVKDYAATSNANISVGPASMAVKMDETRDISGRAFMKISGLPMGDVLQGFDGETVWSKVGGNVRVVGGQQKAEAEAQAFRDMFAIFQNFEKEGVVVQALAGGAVAVSDPARKLDVKLYFDPATKMLVKKVYTAALMGPPAEIEETLSDFREAGGMKLPFKVIQSKAGKAVFEQEVTEWKINPGAPPATYNKP